MLIFVRSFSGQSQVSLRSDKGQFQVSPRSLLGLSELTSSRRSLKYFVLLYLFFLSSLLFYRHNFNSIVIIVLFLLVSINTQKYILNMFSLGMKEGVPKQSFTFFHAQNVMMLSVSL